MYKRQIVKNLSWLTFQEIPSQLLGILFFVLLGQKLGQFGIGSYSYVFSVLAIVSLIIDFGLNNYFWRRWSGEPEKIAADEPLYLTSKMVALVTATVPFLFYIILLDYGLWSFFILAFTYTILDIPRSLPIFAFQSRNKYKETFFINFVDRLVAFGGSSLLVLFGFGLHAVLVTFVLGRISSIIVAFRLYGHIPTIQFRWKEAVSLLIKNKHVFLISLLSYVYFKVDIVVMRRILSVEAVGMYSAAYRILDTLTIIPNIALFAIFPSLAHMAHHKDDDSTSVVVEHAIKYLTAIAIFPAIVCQFYAKEILSFLYHNTFLPASTTLSVLGWTAVLMFSTTPLVYVHLAQKNDRLLVKRLLSLTILNIGMNILLLPLVGIAGAAVATLLTEAVSAVILIRRIPFKLRFHWIWKLGVGALLLVAAYAIIHPPLFYMVSISFILYIVYLYFSKFILISDFASK